MARYEYGEGAEATFWEYVIKGASYTTRWGKIGANNVSSKQHDFDSASLAWRAATDAVDKMRTKGYLLVGPDGKRVPPPTAEVARVRVDEGPQRYIRRYFLRSYPNPTPMYEVELDGNSYIERSWTLDDSNDLVEKRHKFQTADDAQDASDAAIAAKKAQKWEHDSTGGDPPKRKRPKKPRHRIDARAEAALVESPEDPKTWQVYADAMLEGGDAWGEVIVAARTKKSSARQAEATKQILGGAKGAAGCSLTWKHGTIEELSLVPEDEDTNETFGDVLERALEHPAGRLMRRLVLGLWPDNMDWSFDAHLALLANGPVLPLLHTLDLSREAPLMDQPSWRRVGDLRLLWKLAPRLRELRLFGGPGNEGEPAISFGAIVAPHLETLSFKSGGLDRSVARDIGRASLPRLSNLELWFGREEFGNSHTLKDLAGILGGAKLPALDSLGLRNSEWGFDLIEAVAKSAILPRLDELDLSDGVLGHESVPLLLTHAERFAHLKRLSLDNNFFESTSKKALKQAIPGLEFGKQRPIDNGHRYTAIGE